jgi:hypothetical protein
MAVARQLWTRNRNEHPECVPAHPVRLPLSFRAPQPAPL